MESTFRAAIPENMRANSKFVFRQGNPLVPHDLEGVAPHKASSIIIVSDNSRGPDEADAQCIRTSVLLDELLGEGSPTERVDNNKNSNGGVAQVVTEVKTTNALSLLYKACSNRIIPMPTGQFNARRLARMVKMPVTATTSNLVWSFASQSQMYVQEFTDLIGRTCQQAAFYFEDAIILGCITAQGECQLNPEKGKVLRRGDSLILIRPTNINPDEYNPLQKPKITKDPLECYIHDSAVLDRCDVFSPSQLSDADQETRQKKMNEQSEEFYMLPIEYLGRNQSANNSANKILICGWGDRTFMFDLVRELDHGHAHLPRGSQITLFNDHSHKETVQVMRSQVKLHNISVNHVKGNPLFYKDLKTFNLFEYKCIIILCDSKWYDPDEDLSNGIELLEQRDMLRLDSMVMMVHLNVRRLLEKINHQQELNIICEKMAYEGVTRFEDRNRMPLGICVNHSQYAAKCLTQVAYNPKVLLLQAMFGVLADFQVVDASEITCEGELVCFWDLMARAQLRDFVLFGYYEISNHFYKPINVVINPIGDEARSLKREWIGQGYTVKFLMLASKQADEEVTEEDIKEDISAMLTKADIPFAIQHQENIPATTI